MAKRHDKNDSTMDISASQLVPEKRPQPPVVNKNDVSMWIGGVVGADEFAGKKKSASKSRAPLIIGLVVVLAAAAGGAYYMFDSSSSSPTPVAAPAMMDAGMPEPPAPIATMPVDAGVEVALSDAGADASVALAVDAVSGADPAPKKKSTTKKKTVKKKKSATTKKRR